MKRLFSAVFLLVSGVALAQAPSANLPPGHPPIAAGTTAAAPPAAAPSPEALLAELDAAQALKNKPKTFQVAASLGKLYYANGRLAEAVQFLREAADKGEPLRVLYVDQLKAAKARKRDLPTVQDAGCAPADVSQLEQQVEQLRARAKAGETAQVATCARVALAPVLETRQLLAQALFSTGHATGAAEVVDRSLEASPDDAELLFTRATLLLETRGDDLKALAQAKDAWSRSLALRPDGGKAAWTRRLIAHTEAAIAAGGLTRLEENRMKKARLAAMTLPAKAGTPAAPHPMPPSSPPSGKLAPVDPGVAQTFQQTERTPELLAGLQKLVEDAEDHLAGARFQQALDNYKQVIPFQPENGRAKAGMAYALIGLGRGAMADNVWRVAVMSDPAAVDGLGTALKQKGDTKGAKAVWSRLAQTDPEYAQKAGLAARLGQ